MEKDIYLNEESDFAKEVHAKLYKACQDALKGKAKSPHVTAFMVNLHEELELLFHDIMNRTYHPRPGIAFVVDEHVTREVFAAQIRDRIIHHFVFNEVADWWVRHFSNESSSCIDGRGTLYATNRFKTLLRKVSKNYTEPVYCFKGDIKSFFMSLSRSLLYKRVVWGLNQQFKHKGPMYDLLKYLWKEIIFDDPTIGVEKRGNLKLWDKLPLKKSLFNQPDGIGIVIGNLSSQLLSNIFLDQFDRYVQQTLGYKNYGRYVDDFFILVPEKDKEKLLADVPRMEHKLGEMRLRLHPNKRTFQLVDKGISFLGFTIYPGHIIPGKRLKNRTYRRLKEITEGLAEPDDILPYLGLLSHYNSEKILGRIFDKCGLDYNFRHSDEKSKKPSKKKSGGKKPSRNNDKNPKSNPKNDHNKNKKQK